MGVFKQKSALAWCTEVHFLKYMLFYYKKKRFLQQRLKLYFVLVCLCLRVRVCVRLDYPTDLVCYLVCAVDTELTKHLERVAQFRKVGGLRLQIERLREQRMV